MFEQLKPKKFNTIVIDPPWDISMTGKVKRREKRSETLPYKTMTIEEIKNIPIKDIANTGCHVYCWTTNKMLHETFHILESWGVNFHLVMPMVKPSGIAPCMGYVFASEFVILGFFGKPMQKFTNIGKLNWLKFFNGANKHSTKPDEFYNLVEEMSPAPRIDIFARDYREDWDVFGDELPKYACFSCEHRTNDPDDNCGCHSSLVQLNAPCLNSSEADASSSAKAENIISVNRDANASPNFAKGETSVNSDIPRLRPNSKICSRGSVQLN
jgi:N6-adenosine-specific RNA methylase IME4